MKIKTLLLLAVLALASALPVRAEVSFDFFFDALSPHGEWIEVGDYGSCWRPRGVEADWRPYADGYWSYTDGGWTWVSYEDFGGIVYHYGRWVEVDDEGWCWVPDYEWAPAWVSWRSNDDYVGWAPLPPEARWRRDTGFSVWVDSHYDIGPSRFNFCRTHDFGAPYLRPVIVSRFENVTIILGTANVTNISYYDGGGYGGLVHCGGPSFSYINERVSRPIPALKLVHHTNITNINIKNVNVFNSVASGNQLTVLAPRVAPRSETSIKPVAVRSIPAAKISKGWAGVKDPDLAEGIRTRMRQESRGLTPESAPARRVQAADLKMVPAKADPTAPSTVRTGKERGSSAVKKPTAVVTEKPVTDKPTTEKPLDPRTAERMLREKAREPNSENPATKSTATVVEPRQTGTVPKPAVTRLPETEQPLKGQTEKGRTSTRSIPPAVAPPIAVEKKKEPANNGGRAPMVKQRSVSDDEAKARAAAVARERSVADQKARAATVERMRVTEDAARKQKAQSEAAREMPRRQVIEQPRREPAPEINRVKPNDDSAQKAAAQAASRQRQIQSAQQQQQVESARRSQASENARRSQMESARKEKSAAARPQVQRQAPPPPAPRGAPVESSGKGKLSAEEMEALKKSRGR